jgi:F-type H+-transporting ATPase subunit delta
MATPYVDPLGAVYAQALLESAEAAGGLDLAGEVGDALGGLAEAWEKDRVLRAYFLSARVGADVKRAALDRLAEPLPKLLANFLRLLSRRHRLDRLGAVADAYRAKLDERLGRIPVTLTTATPMSEDALRRWTDVLRARLGKEPVLRHEVRPEILAGATIRAGDVLLDGTARRRLTELRQQIIQRGKHHALQP